MRIGLNGTPYDHLQSGARDRFLHLYGEAARRSPGHAFLVYSPREVDLAPLFPGPAAGGARTPFSPRRPLRRFLGSGRWFARRLRRDGADLFLTDHFPVVEAGGTRTLLTVHDLRYLVLPRTGSALRRLYFRRRFAAEAARARAVVTVSETMRAVVLERLGLPEVRVHVVPNGVPEDLVRADPGAVADLRERLRLPSSYLLHVGVLEARKNLGTLLRALALAPDAPPLLLAGRGGPEESGLRRLAADLGLGARVRFVGYVPEPDLPALYSGAAAVAMPSRYEGFGLPVLQAFACGTPVVAARASALPEVAGGAALLADPDDAEAWAAAIRRVLGEEDLRAGLVARGRVRAGELTWPAAAERLLEVLAAAGA